MKPFPSSTSPGTADDRKMFFLVFVIGILFYCWNGWFSKGFNGDADSITHYQIARYSWKYHELFLDQWGKPVFTILSSPFAQIGFKCVVFFNIALILWGAWLSWLIARRLHLSNAWMVPFFVLFAPVVIGNGASALTEMVCSLFLIIYIYLLIRGNSLPATIIISFMPFARSEGFVILAVLALYYLFTKRWKLLPVLACGSIVFNTIGYLQTGQPLWIFTNNPYVTTAINVYGSGSFLHFFIMSVPIFGVAFLFALYTTIVKAPLLGGLISGKNKDETEGIWVWIIMGTAWGYFAAHTFLWWQGMWASLGLTRVMAVIAVPMSLLAVFGYNKIYTGIANSVRRNQLQSAVIFLTIMLPFLISDFPVPLGKEEKEHLKVVEFIENDKSLHDAKIYSANPYFLMVLNKDPYNKSVYEPLTACREAVKGDLIIWDAHFGPNEQQIPLDILTSDSTFVPLGQWIPDQRFKTLNDYDFMICAFQKK